MNFPAGLDDAAKLQWALDNALDRHSFGQETLFGDTFNRYEYSLRYQLVGAEREYGRQVSILFHVPEDLCVPLLIRDITVTPLTHARGWGTVLVAAVRRDHRRSDSAWRFTRMTPSGAGFWYAMQRRNIAPPVFLDEVSNKPIDMLARFGPTVTRGRQLTGPPRPFLW